MHEFHSVSGVRHLLVLATEERRQRAFRRARGRAAVLDVEMEQQDFAPLRRPARSCGNHRKRILDERVDVAPQFARLLRRIEIERAVKRAVRELISQRLVFRSQRCCNALIRRIGAARAGCREQ